MKVLIAEFDLFSKIGGGQTFYRRLIETNPDIEFYYLIMEEKISSFRPKNAQCLIYKQQYIKSDLKGLSTTLPLEKLYRPFLIASNISYSVMGFDFDVIDYPDYEQYGLFLASALSYHQVKFKKIILSLHGIVSQSLHHDWVINKDYIHNLEFAENLQYKIADIRYGISKNYLEWWQKKDNFLNYYYHPLHFFDLTPKINYQPLKAKPSLNFIGRKEKGKGVDIFVNLVSFLPKKLYSQGNIIGTNPQTLDRKTGEFYLKQMLALAFTPINILPSVTRYALQGKFNSNSVTILPSRFDTLNLVALESLFAGCPTIISKNAGICRFLADNFPEIPFIQLDVNNLYSSLPEIIKLLNNYEGYRINLQEKITSISPQMNQKEFSLIDVYNQKNNYEEEARQKIDQWYQELIYYCQKRQYWGKQHLINITKKIVTPIVNQGKNQLEDVKSKVSKKKNIVTNQLVKSIFFSSEYERVFNLQETSAKEIDIKINQLKNLSHPLNLPLGEKINKLKNGYYVNRLKIWQEIARLEKIKGNDLLSATYEIRIIRLLNRDKFNQLQNISHTLINHNFLKESSLLKLLYPSDKNSYELAYEYLSNNYQSLLKYQEKSYEFIKDYREKKNYRVSVIVSLYNAESKLNRFLSILAQQTIFQKQEAEIILIDSGSTQEEYRVFQQLVSILDLPIVYARSKKRETIQSAWNRGILLSQSSYLTFLGVDEMITMDGLEILADKLDQNNNLDWVVGHSLVTEVDNKGNWLRDVMTYNRRNFSQDLVYLDTCYLTYVGGLYRRDLHYRFGFYDETFRGAGDTEFKNRVLPHINCELVENVLGIFWNYPDNRTTQSPLAEIEDIKAWYLYRSVGGIKYTFENQNISKVEKLLLHCLNYRKTFLNNNSTDFDFAHQLILWLEKNSPQSPFLQFAEGIKKIDKSYQQLEYTEDKSLISWQLLQVKNLTQRISNAHEKIAQNLGINNFRPEYQVFNDNRYQQHSLMF
ncbi:glycosyl transferase [Geminocystis sp. NIES-3708]|uniref:glycosyltransferase n=1 Tax=Geminocystis sp. NIES-3708 TaxID=1615909 RepID=UPI0005FC44BA|nr:glycosyltransferase [Geminocystis sp. NIES-3708]BAQ60308.1 glycosyl transferase [Geminocystis sp. NIES-3708]